jgi:hypothetical protein
MIVQDAIVSLADDIPGALDVIGNLAEINIKYLRILDDIGLYGGEIYQVWNIVCRQNTGHMAHLLTACAMDHNGLTVENLRSAIRQPASLDVEQIAVDMTALGR